MRRRERREEERRGEEKRGGEERSSETYKRRRIWSGRGVNS